MSLGSNPLHEPPVQESREADLPAALTERLSACQRAGLGRTLRPRSGVDLCSNDYLSFSEDPLLKARIDARCQISPPSHRRAHFPDSSRQLEYSYPGSAGSRLLRGHLLPHEEAEHVLADFCSRSSALIFPSGYQANLALLSAILGPQDLVFSDEANHASLIDGIRLSQAKKRIFAHNQVDHLKDCLQETRNEPGLKLIVTESLFSMDGDQAPLGEILELCKRYGAYLIVDETHATGLWGSTDGSCGGGLVQKHGFTPHVLATIHSGGKALGCSGAWIACGSRLKDFLIHFSRPLIFSTAPPPTLAISLVEATHYWREVGALRARAVLNACERWRAALRPLISESPQSARIGLPPSSGPILPVLLGENQRALKAATCLQNLGWDIRAIRPPSVPPGTARLRITLHYAQAQDEQLPFRFAQGLQSFLHSHLDPYRSPSP